jgi:hypothetical protein
MNPKVTIDRKSVYLLAYLILAVLVGGLVHNPFDPVRYAKGALGILEGGDIYAQKGVVYPPTLYVVASLLLFVISSGTETSVDGYVTLATFVGIGTAVQMASYLLGDRVIDNSHSQEWAIATLLSPFVVYVVVLFGQMESFVVLAIVGVVYAERTRRWEIGGASVAIAASVKIFPAALFVPLLIRNRENAYRILRGAAPVIIATTLLMIVFLPGSLTIFSSSLYGIRPVNALYLLSAGQIPSWVAAGTFIVSFVGLTLLSACIPDGYVGYLVPFLPVVLVYPDVLEYRWLPIAVGAILLGYLPRTSNPNSFPDHGRYGWLWTLLGTLAMILGTIEGWFDGSPWLVPTFGALQEPATVLGTGQLDESVGALVRSLRLGVVFVFVLSVLHWCRMVYRSYPIRLPMRAPN